MKGVSGRLKWFDNLFDSKYSSMSMYTVALHCGGPDLDASETSAALPAREREDVYSTEGGQLVCGGCPATGGGCQGK